MPNQTPLALPTLSRTAALAAARKGNELYLATFLWADGVALYRVRSMGRNRWDVLTLQPWHETTMTTPELTELLDNADLISTTPILRPVPEMPAPHAFIASEGAGTAVRCANRACLRPAIHPIHTLPVTAQEATDWLACTDPAMRSLDRDEMALRAGIQPAVNVPRGTLDEQFDILPTAYEDSLSRRTGASVEQLRAETAAAMVPRGTFSSLIEADATTTADWLLLPYRVKVTRFEAQVGRQVLIECYACSTRQEAEEAMRDAIEQFKDNPGILQVTIEPPTAENGRLPTAVGLAGIEKWRDGWREQGSADREIGRNQTEELRGKAAVVPYAEGWQARDAATGAASLPHPGPLYRVTDVASVAGTDTPARSPFEGLDPALAQTLEAYDDPFGQLLGQDTGEPGHHERVVHDDLRENCSSCGHTNGSHRAHDHACPRVATEGELEGEVIGWVEGTHFTEWQLDEDEDDTAGWTADLEARCDEVSDLVDHLENQPQETVAALIALARLHQAEFARLVKAEEDETASMG